MSYYLCSILLGILRKLKPVCSYFKFFHLICNLENNTNMQVPFEVLVRRQIARLLDPSLQCTRFIYDELIKVHSWYPNWVQVLAAVSFMLTLIWLFSSLGEPLLYGN